VGTIPGLQAQPALFQPGMQWQKDASVQASAPAADSTATQAAGTPYILGASLGSLDASGRTTVLGASAAGGSPAARGAVSVHHLKGAAAPGWAVIGRGKTKPWAPAEPAAGEVWRHAGILDLDLQNAAAAQGAAGPAGAGSSARLEVTAVVAAAERAAAAAAVSLRKAADQVIAKRQAVAQRALDAAKRRAAAATQLARALEARNALQLNTGSRVVSAINLASAMAYGACQQQPARGRKSKKAPWVEPGEAAPWALLDTSDSIDAEHAAAEAASTATADSQPRVAKSSKGGSKKRSKARGSKSKQLAAELEGSQDSAACSPVAAAKAGAQQRVAPEPAARTTLSVENSIEQDMALALAQQVGA
jgi:hypothetical protein